MIVLGEKYEIDRGENSMLVVSCSLKQGAKTCKISSVVKELETWLSSRGRDERGLEGGMPLTRVPHDQQLEFAIFTATAARDLLYVRKQGLSFDRRPFPAS